MTQNYNHHLKAEVGDYIKSYDFRGVDDCYAVGLVLEKGFLADVGFSGYKIATVERVINGQPEDINIAEEVLITDFENMHDFAERITNVTEQEVGI